MSTLKPLFRLWAAVSPASKIVLAALAIPLLILNIWGLFLIVNYFHALITISVGASLLAFIMNYPVSFMEQHGAKRERAAIMICLLALTLVLALGVTLIPLVLRQAQQLLRFLPVWIDSGQRQLTTLNEQFQNTGLPLNLDVLVDQLNGPIRNQLQVAPGEFFHFALFTLSSSVDLLLTFVLAFYLLQHGQQIWSSLLELLPIGIRQPFSQTLQLSFQNFFRGQMILASLMGVSLTIVFLLLRVPFGLLFGLMIGTLALIPYGGTVGIVTVTLLVSLNNFTLGLKVLLATVLVQQILENLVAPRVLGKMTGLNPVWVFVSILAGVRIAGVLGVIISVPIAVVIKSAIVAVRSSSREEQYLQQHLDAVPPNNLDVM